jgi:hypothetical protein
MTSCLTIYPAKYDDVIFDLDGVPTKTAKGKKAVLPVFDNQNAGVTP